jgi:hypothetical protein
MAVTAESDPTTEFYLGQIPGVYITPESTVVPETIETQESAAYLADLFEFQGRHPWLPKSAAFVEWLRHEDEAYFSEHISSSIIETTSEGNVQGLFSTNHSGYLVLVTIRPDTFDREDVIDADVQLVDPRKIKGNYYKNAVSSTWKTGQIGPEMLHGAICDVIREPGCRAPLRTPVVTSAR